MLRRRFTKSGHGPLCRHSEGVVLTWLLDPLVCSKYDMSIWQVSAHAMPKHQPASTSLDSALREYMRLDTDQQGQDRGGHYEMNAN